jgi:hypothetical protein
MLEELFVIIKLIDINYAVGEFLKKMPLKNKRRIKG